MREIKHTPGPWKVIEREILEDGSVYPRHIVGGERELQVCLLEGPAVAALALKEPNGIYGRNGNGDLIAAAPELLAELQNIANAKPETWDEEMRDQFQQWAQNRARAAIAKATGD